MAAHTTSAPSASTLSRTQASSPIRRCVEDSAAGQDPPPPRDPCERSGRLLNAVSATELQRDQQREDTLRAGLSADNASALQLLRAFRSPGPTALGVSAMYALFLSPPGESIPLEYIVVLHERQ